ncbi:hypothetical protein BV898_06764 [Hypsibius exemplaris]|uniref:Uncharacterized protein n=1 Tax=Hypsibius exemplaris TaxID=2072580 RepID=A0A1W0WV95_HYPEX|nr:hypothetical protein BV898_06764 [Hypsibius exemplaris]
MEKEVETDYQMIRGPRPYEDGADTMTIIKAIKEQRQKERAEKRARQTAAESEAEAEAAAAAAAAVQTTP